MNENIIQWASSLLLLHSNWQKAYVYLTKRHTFVNGEAIGFRSGSESRLCSDESVQLSLRSASLRFAPFRSAPRNGSELRAASVNLSAAPIAHFRLHKAYFPHLRYANRSPLRQKCAFGAMNGANVINYQGYPQLAGPAVALGILGPLCGSFGILLCAIFLPEKDLQATNFSLINWHLLEICCFFILMSLAPKSVLEMFPG